MPITIIVGGQFGSEGKGKVAHYFAKNRGVSAAIRVGGPNSGHTVISENGVAIIFRQLPTASILADVQCILPAGSYIYPRLLLEELQLAKLSPDRLLIDPNAVVITERDIGEEEKSGLRPSIGSTLSGTGAAVVSRTQRQGNVRLARDEELLKPYIRPTTPILFEILRRGERVLIEGTQGFGLSVLHSPHYPYATSRDTTASGFLSEAGLSPLDVDEVVMVIRSYPIRVPGNSGPLENEISWDKLSNESGSRTPIVEYTSVTKTQRRVARFDHEVVLQAILHNRPSHIVLNHLDYVDMESAIHLRHTENTFYFLKSVEAKINNTVNYVGLGPNKLMLSSEL